MEQFNILIAGIPGSGKTTIIEEIKSHLKEKTNIIDFRGHKLNLIEYKDNKDLNNIYGIICLIDYNRKKESEEFCRYNDIKRINGNKTIQVCTKAHFNSYNNYIFYQKRTLCRV